MLPTESTAARPVRPRRTDARSVPDRFIGVDIARFVAIVGMMAAHLWAPAAQRSPEPGFAEAAAAAVDVAAGGTASALFAVLGGLSLVLASVRVRERRGIPGVLVAVVTRGVVIMVLGMLLGLLPNSIIGVLTYFGLAMIVTAPFVVAPTALVAVVLGVLTLFGGWVIPVVVRAAQIDSFGGALSALEVVADPVAALRTALLTGAYPVITWLAYMLAGILVARFLLAARAGARTTAAGLRLALLGGIAGVAAVVVSQTVTGLIGTVFQPSGALGPDELRMLLAHGGFGSAPGTEPWLQLVAAPHTGTVAEIVRNVGVALLVIGLCVAWFDRARTRGSGPSLVTRWIQACGAAPLTVYAVHLVVSSALLLAGMNIQPPPWWLLGFGAWAVQVAVVLLLGLVLLVLRRKGPLEALLGFLTRQAVRLVPERPADDVGSVDGRA